MKKKSAPFLKSLHILAATLLALTMPLQPNQAGAESSNRPSSQVGITVESRVSHEFGRSITFNAKIQTAGAIQQASLLFRGIREETTRVETLQVAADGSTTFAYDATLNVFPPFSEIIYWFQATLTDGSTHTSEPQTYHYTDNRFSWQEISQSIVTVHWYEGDAAFATAALESAAKGLLAMRDIVPVSLTEPVHIYIYSNVEDLSDTFLLGGRAWAGGHAHADLGVILVAISPGANQFTEMDSAIPHELAHVMLYRALGGKYYQQPAWLIEGIASMVELYPSPRLCPRAGNCDRQRYVDSLCGIMRIIPRRFRVCLPGIRPVPILCLLYPRRVRHLGHFATDRRLQRRLRLRPRRDEGARLLARSDRIALA
jgi:hypothetical protein